MTDPVPVTEGVFVVERDGSARLIGSRCGTCGALQFPRSSLCATCGSSDVEELRLGGGGGSLWGWTAVTSAPPGYEGPVPYGFGVVELDEGLRVVTRITESDPQRLHFGQRMRCVVESVGVDDEGRSVVAWAFAPTAPGEPEAGS